MDASEHSVQHSMKKVVSLSNPDHISKAMGYLRTVPNLQKFNKYIYAYRLDESKAVFMTEDMKGKGFVEGYNDDEGFEGNGERLLQIMQRFSIFTMI